MILLDRYRRLQYLTKMVRIDLFATRIEDKKFKRMLKMVQVLYAKLKPLERYIYS